MKKLKTFDSSWFIGKIHFEEDGTQNYLVFQSIYKYLEIIAGVGNSRYIYYWESKGGSDEKINSIKTSNYSITPNLNYCDIKTRVEFNRSCLKQDKVTFSHSQLVNIYIAYEISKTINISDYPTLEDCLFGAATLTKHADNERYKYSRYGIGVDKHGRFSFPLTELGKNVIAFGVDMTSSTKVDDKKKDILILGKGPAKGLEHTLSVEKKCFQLVLQKHNKNFCLSLH